MKGRGAVGGGKGRRGKVVAKHAAPLTDGAKVEGGAGELKVEGPVIEGRVG